jgi:hypothetical protein
MVNHCEEHGVGQGNLAEQVVRAVGAVVQREAILEFCKLWEIGASINDWLELAVDIFEGVLASGAVDVVMNQKHFLGGGGLVKID